MAAASASVSAVLLAPLQHLSARRTIGRCSACWNTASVAYPFKCALMALSCIARARSVDTPSPLDALAALGAFSFFAAGLGVSAVSRRANRASSFVFAATTASKSCSRATIA